jgi:hypothetical protein
MVARWFISNQKSQFGQIFDGLVMEDVNLVNSSAIWYILWPFGIFPPSWYIFHRFGLLYQ